jgi:iron-sulfur cluster repair di-iron protein
MVASDRDLMNTTPPQPSAPLPAPESGSATAADPARTALLDALNELLEAERAGARVAMETGRSITDPALAALVDDIHKDEVRWCSMLMRTIKSLGATPSSTTGAFHGKAMAIADLDERLKFLNRGQAWVVRKLQALVPQVSDAQARADLADMLQAHHQNISRVEARYAAPATAPQAEQPPVPSEPPALIEYILRRFHEVHRRQLPELIRLASKVEAVHADHPDVPRGLAALLQDMHSELLDHMSKEETVLFPMLARGGSAFVTHPICVMMSEHEDHARRLAHLMALTRQATPPGNACSTWVQLCTATREFVADLQQHIRLENGVLFPQFDKSLAQERPEAMR